MAGAALIVVLLVASGEGEDPSIKMAAKTTHDALEGDAIVVVREVERERLDDAEAVKVAEALNAKAVAVVTWRDAQHRNVIVHVRPISGRPEWVDRSFGFADADPASERGRTIGFAVASIVSTTTTTTPATASPNGRDSTSPEQPSEPPTRATAAATSIAIDVLGSGAVGKGSGGLGGDVSGRLWLFFDQRLAARLGVGARFGDVSDANANVVVARFAAGVALRFLPRRSSPHSASPPSSSSSVDVGARLDAVALWHQLSRLDNASSSGSFLTPGFVGAIEAAWMFAPPFALVAAGGAEVALGRIRVLVDNQATTTIEPLRGVAEVGLRWEP